MYTSKDDYFYFRPRSECSGNILPVRVADAEDPSAVIRTISYEDIVYFYELAITKIGLFRWAEDKFASRFGIRGEGTPTSPRGLGFPYPDPASGLELGDMTEFPPYVPARSVLLPDEPTPIASGSASDLDPFGPAFGKDGLSKGLVGMLSLLRDQALCGPYPPYSVLSCRRFAWDDAVLVFATESQAYDDPSERIDVGGGVTTDPESHARAHMPSFPAHASPGSVTDALWSSGPVERTEEGYAEWFCGVFEAGAWIKARAEESGLSILEELRALPYRQGLVKRAWLDLLYFDSVAVLLTPSSASMVSAYSETYDSDGEFSWPEVNVQTSKSGGGFQKAFALVGDFGYSPGSAEPEVTDVPASERASAGVSWSYGESWSASRTYVTCCVATSLDHTAGSTAGLGGVDACTGKVYTGMSGESYSVSSSAEFPSGATRSSFVVRLPPFPSDQLPFDPGVVDEVRGYLTCRWSGSAWRRGYGAVDRERGAVALPSDPLTRSPSEVLTYGSSDPSGSGGSSGSSAGRYLSWGCGWFSGPADVAFDLGGDGSAPVIRVSSPVISSAISAAESAGRCSIASSASPPAYDPLDLAPEPVDGYGREDPEVVAEFSGGSFAADPSSPGDSLAEEYEKRYGSLPAGTVSRRTGPFRYVSDPDPDSVRSASYVAGDPIECPGYFGPNGVTPDPSSGWTTGDEFGLTAYVAGEGTKPCSGTTPYPGYNCVQRSAGSATAGAGAGVSASAAVNGLWLFVRFRPKCAAEIALDALRGHIESEDAG